MKKLLTTLAALIVIATPAFAQSFEPNLGTGNVQPISAEGTTVQVDKISTHKDGHGAFAMVPRSPSASTPNRPALTGGGNFGYNENLKND